MLTSLPHLDQMILDVYAPVRKDPQYIAPHPFGEIIRKEVFADIEQGLRSAVGRMLRVADILVTLEPSCELWAGYLSKATSAHHYRVSDRPKHVSGEVRIPLAELDARRYDHDLYFCPDALLREKPHHKVVLADDLLRSGRTLSTIIDTFTQYGIPVVGAIVVLTQGEEHKAFSERYASLMPRRVQRPFLAYVRNVNEVLQKHDEALAVLKAKQDEEMMVDAFEPNTAESPGGSNPDPSEEKTTRIPLPGRAHWPDTD